MDDILRTTLAEVPTFPTPERNFTPPAETLTIDTILPAVLSEIPALAYSLGHRSICDYGITATLYRIALQRVEAAEKVLAEAQADLERLSVRRAELWRLLTSPSEELPSEFPSVIPRIHPPSYDESQAEHTPAEAVNHHVVHRAEPSNPSSKKKRISPSRLRHLAERRKALALRHSERPTPCPECSGDGVAAQICLHTSENA